MRRFRLRSIMALIAVVALSLWAGMQIERARSASRSNWHTVTWSYSVMRPVGQAGKTYTVMRPVRQVTRGQTGP
jgi:hypothetical protein